MDYFMGEWSSMDTNENSGMSIIYTYLYIYFIAI